MNEKLPESTQQTLESFEPGHVFELPTVSELSSFEDMVAVSVNPDATYFEVRNWNTRVPLKELIRPEKIHGTIFNITIEIMDDARQKLFTTKERNKKFIGSLGIPRLCTSEFAEEKTEQLTRGFILTGDVRSSGKGVIGRIESEIWYVPVSTSYKESGNIRSNSGGGVHRYITKPEFLKTQEQKDTDLNPSASSLGQVALRRHQLAKADQKTIK